jgi:hypothetical protein
MDGSFHPSSPGPGFTRDGRFVVIPDYYFGGRFIFKSVTDGTESIREWTVRPGQQGNFFEQLIDVAGKQIGRLQSIVHGQLPVSPQYAGLDSLDIDTDSIGRAALQCGARDVSFAFSSHKSPLVSTNPKLPHLLAVAGKQSDEIYGVVLFNLKTGTRIDFDQSQHQPLGIAVSDNGEVVVMYETELKLWKTNAKGTFECKTVATFSARPEGMRWLHDIPPNFLVCMSSGRVALVHQNLRLEIWDCLECRKVREWCLSGIHDGDSESTWEYAPLVAVTEDQRLLTATRFGRLDLWDLEKDSPVATASHFIGPSIRRSLRTIGDLAVFVGGRNRFTVLRLPKKDVCAEDRVDRSPSDQGPSAARPPSHADR